MIIPSFGSGFFFIFGAQIFTMKKLLILSGIVCSFALSAQSYIAAYAARANAISQTTLEANLQDFIGFGVKTTGSANNVNALNWLKAKYSSFGYTASQIVEDPFTFGATTSKNLIVTKTGTLYPNKYVIICGHYDTINGVGANDNGTATAMLLEMARILKDVPTDYSIKFIHFSGEEQGLIGSQHYVSNVVNATNPKMDIKVVFNIDEVGGVSGQINNIITCERDTNNFPSTNNAASNTVTQELMNCVTLYSPLQTNLSYAYASDYMPFQSNNEVITGLFEYNESPYRHTANDTYANLDFPYVYNVAKAAMGALQHFAVASTVLSTNDIYLENLEKSVVISPNPAKDFVNIELKNSRENKFSVEIYDMSGKLVSKEKDSNKIDVSNFSSGNYIVRVSFDGQTVNKKLIVE